MHSGGPAPEAKVQRCLRLRRVGHAVRHSFSMGRRIVLHCMAVIVADDAFTDSPGRDMYEANGFVLEG